MSIIEDQMALMRRRSIEEYGECVEHEQPCKCWLPHPQRAAEALGLIVIRECLLPRGFLYQGPGRVKIEIENSGIIRYGV